MKRQFKTIVRKEQVREKLLEASSLICDVVGSTLGPNGNEVLIELQFKNKITKDGVSVAREISLEDSELNSIIDIIKQASINTEKEVGDGTTTSIILADHFIQSGITAENSKHNINEVKKGMKLAVNTVINLLTEKKSSNITDDVMLNIAEISSNNDTEISTLLVDIFKKSKENTTIVVEETQAHETSVEYIEGMDITSGYIVDNFITSPNSPVCEYSKPYIFICDDKLEDPMSIRRVMDHAAGDNKPLLIIANEFSPFVISVLANEKVRHGRKVVAVKSPSFGKAGKQKLKDLAIYTGGRVIGEEYGDSNFNNLSKDVLGECGKIIIDEHSTKIVGKGGDPEKIKERIQFLKAELELENESEKKDRLNNRIAKLTSGIATVKAGGRSQAEVREKVDRIEDAYYAVKAALKSGVVPGGGVALLRLYKSSEFERLMDTAENQSIKEGVRIVKESMKVPFYRILENGGDKPDVVMDKLINSSLVAAEGKPVYFYGYDARKYQYGNCLDMGIIDPVDVTINALSNSLSVALTLLNTRSIINISKHEY